MGFFSKKQSESEPVRESQVKRLKKALDDEDDAILCDEGPSGHRDFKRARAKLEAVMRNSTETEVQRAHRGRSNGWF